MTANNLDGELVGAKRLLEASGLGYFRVSGYPSLFSSGKFRRSLPVITNIKVHLISIDTHSSQAGSLCDTYAGKIFQNWSPVSAIAQNDAKLQ